MTATPDRSKGSNWVENPDGNVVPSYTGPNAPAYPGIDKRVNREDLDEMHLVYPLGVATVIAGIKAAAHLPERPKVARGPHHGDTLRYLNSRGSLPTSGRH